MAIRIPVPASSTIVSRLAAIVGPEGVSVSDLDRLHYSRDMYPGTLILQSEGVRESFPDVVVWPENTEQVQQIVRFAAEQKMAVVPFGAGSGVCGGTTPVRGGIMLDMKRMSRVIEVNDDDLSVTAQPGIMGQNLENELERRGYTMGHFPSSIYCSTYGGWVATRSAGQLSSRYGKIEDMVLGCEFVTADGEIRRAPEAPGEALGPDWRQIMTGSEGTLGVLTEATCRIWPTPETRLFVAFTFPDVPAGVQAMRLVMRHGLRPAAMRLYDPLDTMMVGTKGAEEETSGVGIMDYVPLDAIGTKLRAMAPKIFRRAQRAVNRWADVGNKLEGLARQGCLMVLMFEGSDRLTRFEFDQTIRFCERLGGRNLGPEPALKWYRNRYHVSYKMIKVFYNQAFVDTIEVACSWDRVARLYKDVRDAIKTKAFIMAHFSHAYPDGCSIYFTFVGSAMNPRAAHALHQEVWRDAMDVTVRTRGTISHHHGVGLSKAEFMPRELGDGVKLLRALKNAFDPDDVMNPGKLGL
ncbi:MAG: FAD-binding oxidoreductase [Deltaproteobacteria bacterium]|nr:FAD-binding oxidoreductase [Deltaproteobacteria bacterium]